MKITEAMLDRGAKAAARYRRSNPASRLLPLDCDYKLAYAVLEAACHIRASKKSSPRGNRKEK